MQGQNRKNQLTDWALMVYGDQTREDTIRADVGATLATARAPQRSQAFLYALAIGPFGQRFYERLR